MSLYVVVDPGHGGDDPGAIGNGIVEKDLNLKISQYMYDRFKALNIPVKMTRTTDETVDPELRVQRILNAFGDNPNVIVISNHINADGGDGAEVIYALRDTNKLSNLVLNNLSLAGQNIRKAYQRRLPTDTSKDYYFIHRETGTTEPIIVEYGFLDSTGDDVTQLKNNYKQFAEAALKSVLEYKGISYTPISTGNYYIVKSGDSLWSIAKKLGVTVDQLKASNKLTSNSLSIGQSLIIPSTTTTDNIYTVVAGDNLYSIARKFGVTVGYLMDYNNLTSVSLSLGQKLKIPVVETTIPEDYTVYTVKSGDTLYSIATANGLTMAEIMEFNNLASSLLSIGQQLKLPISTSPNFITYTVKSGDNLYSIAQKYSVTQEQIMSYNNLTSNLLSVGQVLKIPTTGTITYTVKSGDNLYSIAEKFNTTAAEIKAKNNLTSNLLSIGQILTI